MAQNLWSLTMNIKNKKTGPLDRLITHMAVSGFGQVLKSDPREKPEVFSRDFAARVFGLWPNTCRPSADEAKVPDAREKKPVVPRVKRL